MEKEMNKKKYKLTISILASNRKDTLPKTLESLKPILDNVSSELIVVDTGCDEDLLEIVRQYTYKIEKFEWCKDFAKARNVGIDKAQGDWFMFIDDDEWFEDVTEFIEFFNSDEMYKYNYAKYVVRNYVNMEGTSWSDSIAGRMFRLFEGTRFVDAIHERPTNIASPTKSFTAYAHHYGYVYKSEEDRRAHVKRNTELLLEQIKKEPGIARHYCHLTQEYNNIKEYEKSMEYAIKGIEATDMSVKENIKDIAGLYGTVIWLMLNQYRYAEAITQAEEYLKYSHLTELGRISLYGFCATAAYKVKDYKKSIEYAEKFFEMDKVFKDNPDLVYLQDTILITSCVDEENYMRVNGVAFAASVMLEDVGDMLKYSSNMKNGPEAMIDAKNCMIKIGSIIGKSKEYDTLGQILDKMVKNQHYFSFILNELEKMRKEDEESFLNAADSMAYVNNPNGYVQLMRIISNRNNDHSILDSLYSKAINDINDIINLPSMFWDVAVKASVNVAEYVEKKPLGKWVATVDEWAKEAKVVDLIEKKNDLSKTLYEDGMHMQYFDMVLIENLLYRKKTDDITLDGIKSELIKYVNTVMNFYRVIYKDDVFITYPTILPNRCQAVMHIMKVLCGDATDIKSECEEIVRLLPLLKKMLDKYLQLADV